MKSTKIRMLYVLLFVSSIAMTPHVTKSRCYGCGRGYYGGGYGPYWGGYGYGYPGYYGYGSGWPAALAFGLAATAAASSANRPVYYTNKDRMGKRYWTVKNNTPYRLNIKSATDTTTLESGQVTDIGHENSWRVRVRTETGPRYSRMFTTENANLRNHFLSVEISPSGRLEIRSWNEDDRNTKKRNLEEYDTEYVRPQKKQPLY